MTKIEMGKTYRTREGKQVRIYSTDAGGVFSVHGAWKTDEGWELASWTEEGLFDPESIKQPKSLDLIEVRPRIKRTVWVNVYEDETYSGCNPTKEEADDDADPTRIACVKLEIDVEEGHGLS